MGTSPSKVEKKTLDNKPDNRHTNPAKILGVFWCSFGVPNPQNAEIKTTDRKTETSQCAGQALGLSTATPQHI